MILITSAAYVTPGLASEFGKIPPCMLPVQNKRLYEHQIALCGNEKNIVISLPQSYFVPSYDRKRLKELGGRIVFVPDNFTLGQSIVYVLNVLAMYDEPLYLLHGDTLFPRLSFDKDIYSISVAEDNYDWATVSKDGKNVYSGYFSFSSQSLLIRCITTCDYNFIQGIHEYENYVRVAKVKMPCWMDFGLVNSYYRSISRLTTERVFNNLKITKYSVLKSSKDRKKMAAEAHWFESLPKSLKHYVPAVFDMGEQDEKGYYEIEYYYLSSLSNIFVFGENKDFALNEIVDSCVDYLSEEFSYKPKNRNSVARTNDKLFTVKTLDRLKEYSRVSGISLTHDWVFNGQKLPSLLEIVNHCDTMISKSDARFVSIMHGDPCFSNILYDFKSKSVKLIDPRGLDTDGNLSVYGDFRYDVAKFAHSIIGLYDFIIAGMFQYEEKGTYNVRLSFDINENLKKCQDYFETKTFEGYSLGEMSVKPILVNLFLSMLPLHRDNPKRQKAMLANALRLYMAL